MIKRIIWIVVLFIAIGFGFMSAAWWYADTNQQTKIKSQGVLQQVQKVFELVTVEGQFSEIYDYEDYYYYDWSILRKKALVKIQAKVSMGYKLSNIEIDVNEVDKVISIGPIPKVKITSMDINEEFYDIQEGTFNTFQPEDYNKIQKDIREIIRSKAKKSSLPADAEDQLNTLLEGLSSLLGNYGWSIQVSGEIFETPQLKD
jgi:hypothetical protein